MKQSITIIHKTPLIFQVELSQQISVIVPGTSLELVDTSEDGEIGKDSVDIATVHLRGITHRGVWILLFNANKTHILFVRRSNSTVICAGAWNTIGEHTKIGESYQAAILRGLREELNIVESDLLMLRPLGDLELFSLNHYSVRRFNRQWTQTYIGLLADDIVNFDPKETSAMQWVKSIDAVHWITSCDFDVTTGSCVPRTCTDSTNITITNKRTAIVTAFGSYGDLLASKILAALHFFSL